MMKIYFFFVGEKGQCLGDDFVCFYCKDGYIYMLNCAKAFMLNCHPGIFSSSDFPYFYAEIMLTVSL